MMYKHFLTENKRWSDSCLYPNRQTLAILIKHLHTGVKYIALLFMPLWKYWQSMVCSRGKVQFFGVVTCSFYCVIKIRCCSS